MILKAVKILPYLLPTTANVTMGVLNTRDNQLRSNYVTNMTIRPTLQENDLNDNWGNIDQMYRYYTYTNSNTAGLYLAKSVSTSCYFHDQGRYWLESGQYTSGGRTRNLNSRNYTLIRYKTAWLSTKLTISDLIIDEIVTTDPLQIFTLNITTLLGVMMETEELKETFETDWTTANNLYDNYDRIVNSFNNGSYIKQFYTTTDHLSDDDNLWDENDDPNINEDIYLEANTVYYIGITTDIQYTSPNFLELDSTVWDNKETLIGNPTLQVTITGTPILNYPLIEVVDIPGLMFTILTMPFSFISQAFNITLFPNTIYSVNISGIFLSIIALLVFAWIIKLVLRTLK